MSAEPSPVRIAPSILSADFAQLGEEEWLDLAPALPAGARALVGQRRDMGRNDASRAELFTAQVLARYRVNLVVDNAGAHGAPVIIENNPLFRALFGSIEYQSDNDVLVTDFSRIRAGSLLKAHGGFLMLHLRDLLSDEPVWEKLRRFLRSGRLQIEEPAPLLSPMATVSLEPEPVDADVKLVLIASVEDYYAVQEGDPEFARRFRCKVDFADSFAAEAANARRIADLFAGCGTFALPLSERSEVHAVEGETAMTAAMEKGWRATPGRASPRCRCATTRARAACRSTASTAPSASSSTWCSSSSSCATASVRCMPSARSARPGQAVGTLLR